MNSSSLWDVVKSTAHSNYLATQLANEIDSWLIADNYLHAKKVVGTLETEDELIISDDFMKETRWDEQIIVWSFRDTAELSGFKHKLNEVLSSFMTRESLDDIIKDKVLTDHERKIFNLYWDNSNREVTNSRLQYLAADLFRFEKQTDIMVGRFPWKGYALDPPVERFGKDWYWAKIQRDPPISLDASLLGGAIARIQRHYFRDAIAIDPVQSPNRRRRELREVGGEYVRTMGRLSFMRQVRTLGHLLQKQPI